MIVGQPGSGKTMLLKSLALNYANGPWDIPQHPVAIFLELNRLSDTKLTIEQQLIKTLARDNFPNGTNFVEQGLKQGMIMLLFDGLDEVNSTDRPNVVRRLQDFIDQYDQCRVAITCRTQVYKREFDAQVDQTVEVVEFNDQQIRKFLRPWKQSMGDDKSVEQLLQALQDKPRIMELARNPLMLTIIAYLYTDTAFLLPHSRAEFYQKATDILLETWDEARQTPNRYKGRDKKSVLRHLALFGQDQTKGKKQDRRHLNWSDVNKQVASILSGLNLKAENDLEPILEEICERSGLLMPIDGGEGYQFTHLTLQEFFAATQLVDDVEGLIERFSQDPDTWRETAKLWCGLARDSTVLIQAINGKDNVTAFSCLADAQNVKPELATTIIEYFKNWIKNTHPAIWESSPDIAIKDNIIKAFGTVCADQRPRGKDIFNFLLQILDEKVSNNNSIDYAAQAITATNIPEAAKILANLYSKHPDIQLYLVGMGNLAVPQLQVLIKDGHLTAIKNLGEIGTPEAAKTLVPFLWDDREAVAFHSAAQIAALLQKADIEEDLANFPKEDFENSSRTWQGIWDPFDALNSSATPIIVEQIIDQLVKGLKTQQLSQIDLPDLDPRIVLPICILSNQAFCKPLEDWIDTAQTLLENTKQGAQLETKSPQLIRDALKQQPQSLQWEIFLKTLPLRMQLDLLYRLSANQPPTKNDWQNLFTMVTYDLRTSWHYRLVVAIAFVLSTIALFEISTASIRSTEILFFGTSTFSAFIVSVFWLVLWRGTEQPLEPNLFISLGIQGPATFCREYMRLLQHQIVWNGAQAMFNTITNVKNISYGVAITFAMTFAIAFADTNAIAITIAIAIAIAFAGAFASAFTSNFTRDFASDFASAIVNDFPCTNVVAIADLIADAVAFTGSITVAVFVAVLVAVFVAVFVALAGTFNDAFPIAFLIAVAVAGIGYWGSKTTTPVFRRCLAVLAAPFFCGSPVVVYFSTFFMHNTIGLSWPNIVLVWLGIVSICTLLLRRGREQERLAHNPLKGILPEYDTTSQRSLP
ncbi:NACHT domain-containing protein [Acaryochloris sp. IP29b_bin.137]|uniref:NACHT domain-containing protein n=1 Tax=Acaryochloris sp. IP29b_bin.137 TaxID=2969217 RepID=UPI0026388154|nr:NACHT domain-containing protein [Acaryochloris sp. IP29b_bin.137]